MNRFNGKSILVTGGTSGIGLATAKAFAAEGARVVVTGRDAATLAKIQGELGNNALTLRADAGSLADAKRVASELATRDITLDAVFINAGAARFAGFADVDESLWDDLFDTNLKGAYFQLQALLPRLNGSINARIGMPNTSVYAASKAALISLAKTLSAELLPRGIRVNVVSPGPVTTPIYGKLGLDGEQLKETAAHIQSQIPLGRFGTAEEIASTVLHLSAPESAFIVGTEIIADGGMSQL